jgi:hypothetical protein
MTAVNPVLAAAGFPVSGRSGVERKQRRPAGRDQNTNDKRSKKSLHDTAFTYTVAARRTEIVDQATVRRTGNAYGPAEIACLTGKEN